MDAAVRVLVRLDRVERLERAEAEPRIVLAELCALAAEAERWAREEGDERALAAAVELRRRTEGMSGGDPNG